MVQRSLPLVPANSLDNNFSRKIREFTEQLAINEVGSLTRYGYVTPNDVPELLDQHIKKSPKGFGGTVFPSYPLFSTGC
ncbi:hypothetical protein L6452_22632 [Arctium lappa]|uniref:Uncharacterized protein n=1 Tax=Arctium lappa TaxID=4217 RepID=A0ACB9B1L3_ARCLA|nr:hypothetical protein L6452_22632 [Arctium lappa]